MNSSRVLRSLVACTMVVSATAYSADIEVFRADDIKPVGPAPTLNATPSATVTNNARSSAPVQNRTRDIEVFQAEQTRRNRPAGVDAVTKPGLLDTNLVGKWILNIPGVAYQTEHDRGPVTERRLHTGAGATFGELTISARGTYEWVKNGVPQRGRLEQVVPRNSAQPHLTYWQLRHERETFYLFATSTNQLTVCTRYESPVAEGKRRSAKAK